MRKLKLKIWLLQSACILWLSQTILLKLQNIFICFQILYESSASIAGYVDDFNSSGNELLAVVAADERAALIEGLQGLAARQQVGVGLDTFRHWFLQLVSIISWVFLAPNGELTELSFFRPGDGWWWNSDLVSLIWTALTSWLSADQSLLGVMRTRFEGRNVLKNLPCSCLLLWWPGFFSIIPLTII